MKVSIITAVISSALLLAGGSVLADAGHGYGHYGGHGYGYGHYGGYSH